MSGGRLFWFHRDGRITELMISKARTTIGRSSRCDVRIAEPSVSAQHAVLIRSEHGMLFEDLKSTNGSRVNGRRVDQIFLKHGDQIELGSERLVFFTDASLPPGDLNRLASATRASLPTGRGHSDSGDQDGPRQRFRSEAAEGPAPAQAPSATAGEPGAKFRAFVVLLSGRAAGQRYPLTKPVTTLGQEGMQVFQIVQRPEGYFAVRGQNSTAPYVNGVPVETERGVLLSHNDKIELAGAALRFEIEPA